jgi:hypothetical protein
LIVKIKWLKDFLAHVDRADRIYFIEEKARAIVPQVWWRRLLGKPFIF